MNLVNFHYYFFKMEEHSDDVEVLTFLNNMSDDSSEEETQQKPQNIVSRLVNNALELQIKKRLTKQATSDIIKLMNNMPGAKIRLPHRTTSITAYSNKEIDYKFFLKCEQCDEFVEDNTVCQTCQRQFVKNSKKTTSSFISRWNYKFVEFFRNILMKLLLI